MLFKFNPKSIKVDFLIVFTNAIAVIVGVFIINWYVAKYFGTEILGHYLYIRRFFTSLIGASLVGMNIGLPFYLPRSKSDVVKNSAFTIFIFLSIPIIVIFSYFISLSSSLAGKEVSILIYIMYGIGLNSQAITYARFRG